MVNDQMVNNMTVELHRNTTPVRMRNYGRIVQDMVAYVSNRVWSAIHWKCILRIVCGNGTSFGTVTRKQVSTG